MVVILLSVIVVSSSWRSRRRRGSSLVAILPRLIVELISLSKPFSYLVPIVRTPIHVKLLLALHGYPGVLAGPDTSVAFILIVLLVLVIMVVIRCLELASFSVRVQPPLTLVVLTLPIRVLIVTKKSLLLILFVLGRLRFTLLSLLMLSWVHFGIESNTYINQR